MKKMSKFISIICSVLLLAQVTTRVAFAERLDLVWTLEPTEFASIGEPKNEAYGYNYDYSHGLVFQQSGSNVYGVMDKYGKVLIPAEYDRIAYFYADKYFQVVKNGQNAVIDTSGKTVIEYGAYDELKKCDDTALIAKKDGLYGLVSPANKVLSDFQYDKLVPMNFSTLSSVNLGMLCAYKGDKCGVIDTSGKVILPIEYEGYISPLFGGKLFLVGFVGDQSIIDRSGKTIVSDVTLLNTVSDNVLSVTANGGTKAFYIDENGNEVHDESLGKLKYIGSYYIRFETDKYYGISDTWKRGLADKNMNILIPCQYRELETSIYDDIFRVKEDRGDNDAPWVYVDAHGNPVDYLNQNSYVYLTTTGDVISKQEHFGMTDKEGNVIIPFEYESIGELNKGLFCLTTTDGKIGLAEFGVGKKVNNTTEAIVLTIGSNNAKAFNKDVAMDAAPVIRNDRTMLPIRFVAENLGANVDWNNDSRTVTIKAENIDISLVIGANRATVNGEEKELDSPSFIENDRTYLPVRFVAENLGADVKWDGVAKTITITQ